MEGINQEELEQAAEGLAAAVNEASADGKMQFLKREADLRRESHQGKVPRLVIQKLRYKRP
ncbi:hypothetical protein [Anaplasma marginale]